MQPLTKIIISQNTKLVNRKTGIGGSKKQTSNLVNMTVYSRIIQLPNYDMPYSVSV